MGTKRWRDYKGIWYTARQEMNHDDEIKHFHRFHGYDYSRGAAMMLSFHLEPRVPVFGRVNGNRMEYSDIGMIARKVLAKERDRTPDVQLKKSIIMPEHVHLRLYLRPGQECPLERMGRFVYNFKAWTRNHAKKVGVGIGWQKNYHDWILPSREIISLADKYIENNPLKWSLMHGNPPPLKVVEPICAAAIPVGEWWSGVGRVDWLSDPSMKFAAVRLSRSIPHAEVKAVCDRLIKAAEKGYVLAGTWISPCERILFEELVRRELPIVKGSQDPLAMVYRPKGDETRLFGDGRLLILSRVFAESTARGVGWHGINDAIGKIAKAAGGESVYVHWNSGEGVKWDFAK